MSEEYFIVFKIELPIVDVLFRYRETIHTPSEIQYDVGDRRSDSMIVQSQTVNGNNNVYDNKQND